ncbi:hypothetical protein GJ496_007606 [Pomphorhynchus laevis]|nr:hypothetical protein GJ496_007606 [Pomphorhynchus laevis]
MYEDLLDIDNDFVLIIDPANHRRNVNGSTTEDLHATSCTNVSDHIEVDDTLDDRSDTVSDADWLGNSHASAIGNQLQTTAKN